ncbi:RNA polymerase sigma factor [Aquimarina algiphila]|uniref:Sigma-70 family RNA polymerase sigma factor n=1 Tax=Aquimarina algiphila TaxID=2047982 RepID=A0A554VNC7_9FLAO|nr:sigma-70 family RNA polymerase sigma factor [Aquimarina algiphila]TSE09860.1 sigma-70 family RNA polymerase sigma factor [Aquimarina algiphila]
MSNSNQDSIIEGIVVGDERIIKKFYEKHLPQVKSYILKNSGSEADAEDVFQDAMVFVYEKLENNSLQLTSSLGTFVYSVCRNLWRNKLKGNKKTVHNESILSISKANDLDIIDQINDNERRYVFQKCFLKLGTGCQELLSLFFEGVSMKDIAKQNGYSEAYTRKKKFGCKNKLVAMVKEDPIFEEIKINTK